MTSVLHVRAFEDNYIWLIRGKSATHAAAVDPGDAAPVIEALERQRLELAAVLCTHHHEDHTGGAAELATRFAVPVYGPARERIPAVTHPLRDGERPRLAELGLELAVLDTPGHTAGHIAYFGDGLLFCGDTLFSAGCGRLFEGTASLLYASLSRLAALPENTAVYSAHEYTEANLRFALAVEPDNLAAQAHGQQVRAWRARGRPTLPSTIGLERRINPFLRCAVPTVRRAAESQAGRALDTETEVFAVLRRWKDGFRG
jgi:hydroxyacylglutathione hydrolase